MIAGIGSFATHGAPARTLKAIRKHVMSALDDAGPIIHKEGTMSLIPEGRIQFRSCPSSNGSVSPGWMMEVGSPGTVRRFEPSKRERPPRTLGSPRPSHR